MNIRKVLKRVVKWAFGLVLAAIVAGGLWLFVRSEPAPWTAAELAILTQQLNEAAAIGVPHEFLMADQVRAENLPLLQKVERGVELDAAESLRYRQVFQANLQASQKFLGAFDRELSVLVDHGMEIANNAGGKGIAGAHDHHDVSARKNFAKLLQSLERLDGATFFLQRIWHANQVQKDLADLISHLGVAPHTVSVVLEPQGEPWEDVVLGKEFDAMLQGYKQAQFANVHTVQYWQGVELAERAYAGLILAVQDRVRAKVSDFEWRLAGRFMATQTLAPPVELERPLRPRP